MLRRCSLSDQSRLTPVLNLSVDVQEVEMAKGERDKALRHCEEARAEADARLEEVEGMQQSTMARDQQHAAEQAETVEELMSLKEVISRTLLD